MFRQRHIYGLDIVSQPFARTIKSTNNVIFPVRLLERVAFQHAIPHCSIWPLNKHIRYITSKFRIIAAFPNLVEDHGQQDVNQNGRANADNCRDGEYQAYYHGINASPVGKACAYAKNFLVGFIKR